MNSRHDITSSDRSYQDDQLPPPPYSRNPEPYFNRNAINVTGDPDDDKDRETQPLLDECRVESSSGVCCPCPARYTMAIWAFLGFFCLYSMRVNLSVAIVAMVCIEIFS
jgi:hypothetical protein